MQDILKLDVSAVLAGSFPHTPIPLFPSHPLPPSLSLTTHNSTTRQLAWKALATHSILTAPSSDHRTPPIAQLQLVANDMRARGSPRPRPAKTNNASRLTISAPHRRRRHYPTTRHRHCRASLRWPPQRPRPRSASTWQACCLRGHASSNRCSACQTPP